jgi:hypothetical protein
VAGELIQPQHRGPAHGGQDDHGQAGGVPAAQALDGQDGQQQGWSGGQDSGDQQDQQAQRLGLGGMVQRLDQRPIDHNPLSHGDRRWLVNLGPGSSGSAPPDRGAR